VPPEQLLDRNRYMVDFVESTGKDGGKAYLPQTILTTGTTMRGCGARRNVDGFDEDEAAEAVGVRLRLADDFEGGDDAELGGFLTDAER
jgi:hypothetical protein